MTATCPMPPYDARNIMIEKDIAIPPEEIACRNNLFSIGGTLGSVWDVRQKWPEIFNGDISLGIMTEPRKFTTLDIKRASTIVRNMGTVQRTGVLIEVAIALVGDYRQIIIGTVPDGIPFVDIGGDRNDILTKLASSFFSVNGTCLSDEDAVLLRLTRPDIAMYEKFRED